MRFGETVPSEWSERLAGVISKRGGDLGGVIAEPPLFVPFLFHISLGMQRNMAPSGEDKTERLV